MVTNLEIKVGWQFEINKICGAGSLWADITVTLTQVWLVGRNELPSICQSFNRKICKTSKTVVGYSCFPTAARLVSSFLAAPPHLAPNVFRLSWGRSQMGPKLSWSLLTSLIGAIFLEIYIYIYFLLSLLFFPSIIHLLAKEKK